MVRLKRFLALLPALMTLLTLLAGSAQAALKDVGPLNPSNGFPVWYRDASSGPVVGFPQGLPLQQCLSQAISPFAAGSYMCNLLPELLNPDDPTSLVIFDPAQPIVFPSNFPSELFWWSGDALIAPGAPGNTLDVDATLVLGLEGAFSTGPVLAGDQVSFGRIRIRVDVPAGQGGTYRITHPYGVDTFDNVTDTNKNDINFTQDLGLGAPGQFGGALASRLGPFLVWTPDAGPATPTNPDGTITVGTEIYVGDPNIEHTVTGSPFNTNFFRVERLDAQGNVIGSAQTDLFAITGKIYTTPIPTPMAVKRAVYSRTVSLTVIDVFATAGILSNQVTPTPSALEVTATGLTPQPMVSDGEGNFYLHYEVPVGTALPNTLTVTNTADNQPVPVNVSLVDDVAISAAIYDPTAKTLRIQGTSSDKVTPPAIVTQFGPLNESGSLTVSDLLVPPPVVVATSSIGGSDVEPVRISMPALVPPATGVTLAANVASPQVVNTTITFVAAGAGGSGSYEYRFWLNSGSGYTIVQDYGSANSWAWTPAIAGAYDVFVEVRSSGSTALRDAFASINFYQITGVPAPPTSVTATADPAGSQTINTPITLTASAGGGSGPYEYRFYVNDGGNFYLLQPYSTSATCTWVPGKAGTFDFFVEARAAGSSVQRDAFTNIFGYTVTTPTASAVSLTSDVAAPQSSGATVTFTAVASGGAGPYEYRFYLNSGAGYVEVQPYGPANTFAWTPSSAGIYDIFVEARTVGSAAFREAYNSVVAYQIN
ncbi:MAG: hypothetical protein EG824_12535 [Deltaproteobacteria bacterium]|nr:hypothetical protein [Deltaproteobacteria bacterium]